MLLLAVVLSILPVSSAFRQQSVGVKGRLMCGSQPLPNATIKLWDKNTFGADDQLASAKSDKNGDFIIEGGIGSILPLDVHFKVYHDCEDGIKPCQRRVNLKVPSSYVTRTSSVQQYFDAGQLNMAFKYPDEERSCIN